MKHIAILGSTGSIGTQTLDVVREHKDKFKIIALSAGTNSKLILEQIREFQPKLVSVQNKEIAERLRADVTSTTKIVYGDEGLNEVATHPDVHFLITAVVGSVGLKPTISAIKAGKTIGLANKETLVSAGHIVMELAQRHNVPIIPIDSEHSAIFQSLNGEKSEEVKKLILTASGGSFRNKTRKELEEVTLEQALKHPNWSMGAKITIDSATMMNKGLEIIEAHWLFQIPFEKIEVLIHPESIIHSMVEYIDKAVIAQLGTPDMKVPIQYALSFPNRITMNEDSLDLSKIGTLHFEKPNFNRFPSLKLAYQCGKEGGTLPTVLNAANEVAVEAFLKGKIPFISIENIVEQVLEQHNMLKSPDLNLIYETDQWARITASQMINRKDR